MANGMPKPRVCDTCGKEFMGNRSGSRRCQTCLNKKRRLERRAFINEIKEKVPCLTCGEMDPIVKQFHHVDPSTKLKRGSRQGVGGLASSSITMKALKEEIAKCVVLCANCHLQVEAGTRILPKVEEGSIQELLLEFLDNDRQAVERAAKQPSLEAPSSFSRKDVNTNANSRGHPNASRDPRIDAIRISETFQAPSVFLSAD